VVKVGGIVGTFAHSTVSPPQNSDRKPSTLDLATNDALIDGAPGAVLRSKRTLMLGILSPRWERGPYKNVGAWPNKNGWPLRG